MNLIETEVMVEKLEADLKEAVEKGSVDGDDGKKLRSLLFAARVGCRMWNMAVSAEFNWQECPSEYVVHLKKVLVEEETLRLDMRRS
ncbi:hypothetical protein LCGC14_0813710 [marine sediment metagenome]|uniref:Uncharacterized protein n=1 Tax=marine sediment metagenome TaxID=412755 RepID=A0A0F9PQG5_9ZZZZ